MKIKVTKPLKVYVGEASINATSYQHLAPESTIEVDGELYEGEAIAGNSKWYKDEVNNYYWSGAVTVVENQIDQESIDEHDASVERSDRFDFSEQIKQTIPNFPEGIGQGITIAVLDSGIDTRFPSLKSRIKNQKNYQNDTGYFKHGSQVAGFLVANNNKLRGLCPESKLLDLRVANDNGNIINSAVVNALEDIYTWNNSEGNDFCDIINMSLDIDHEYPNLQSKINDLVAQGVIILVAGTEGEDLNSIAKLEGVIPVGTFFNYQFDDLKQNGFHSELVTSFLNKGMNSTSEYPNYELFEDSSAYTAITSGLISKYLSSKIIDKSVRKSKVLEFLNSISLPIKTQIDLKPLTPYT